MRIGIDARLLGPRVGGGGLGRYIEELIRNLELLESTTKRWAPPLSGESNEYVIFLRKENWEDYESKAQNFKKVLAPWRWYTLREQLHMPRVIRKQNLDLIHYPHFNIPIFAKTPFVVTIHDLNLIEYPKAGITNLDPFRFWTKYLGYRFVLSYALRNAKKIIAVSETTRQTILRRFPTSQSRIVAISLGYELGAPGGGLPRATSSGRAGMVRVPQGIVRDERARTDKSEDPRWGSELSRGATPEVRPYILAVGNAYPHKNLHGLLAAFREVLRDHPETTLVLAGPDDRFRDRVRHRTAELGIADRVKITGFVSDAELDTLYCNATAYICPSLLEGFGFPGLEAQARGTPVLASDLTVLHETFGEAALYFDPKNPGAIADAIRTVLNDAALRERLKTAGFENIKRFNWQSTAKKTLEIYRASAPHPNLVK